MKNFLLTTILVTYWATLQAQTYHIYYNIGFKKDSLQKEYKYETMVLDIGKEKVKFYSADILEKDSLRKATGEYEYSYSELGHQVSREKGKNQHINYKSLSPYYYSYKTTDEIQWKLFPDKKKIGDFVAQKATSNFGGRAWEAWFTLDLPFQEGPYKFRGLPGLIVELRDTKENYIFSLVKIKKLEKEYDTSFYFEKLNDLVPIEITEKKMRKLLMDYYTNPLKDFETQNVVVQDKDGNMKTLETKDVLKIYQDRIRKNNNPIELNKAIVYPTKN